MEESLCLEDSSSQVPTLMVAESDIHLDSGFFSPFLNDPAEKRCCEIGCQDFERLDYLPLLSSPHP